MKASSQLQASAVLLQEKDPLYLFSRRLGELQSHSGRSEGEWNLFALLAIEPRLLGRQVRVLFTLPATLFQLSLCFILNRSGQIFSQNMPR